MVLLPGKMLLLVHACVYVVSLDGQTPVSCPVPTCLNPVLTRFATNRSQYTLTKATFTREISNESLLRNRCVGGTSET